MCKRRCLCVYQRQGKTWRLRVIHWRCPQHGTGDHWTVMA
jgi:hypothetical protein